jgi:hypothetical protein
MGNTSRGLRRGTGGRGRQTTVRRGTAASASNLHSGKAAKKGKRGRGGSSPQGEALMVACGNRRAVRRQRRKRPRSGGEGGSVARVAKQKGVAAGLPGPRARGGGFLGRPRVPWRAGPGIVWRGKAVPRLDLT